MKTKNKGPHTQAYIHTYTHTHTRTVGTPETLTETSVLEIGLQIELKRKGSECWRQWPLREQTPIFTQEEATAWPLLYKCVCTTQSALIYSRALCAELWTNTSYISSVWRAQWFLPIALCLFYSRVFACQTTVWVCLSDVAIHLDLYTSLVVQKKHGSSLKWQRLIIISAISADHQRSYYTETGLSPWYRGSTFFLFT